MADVFIHEQYLTDIADAIRLKLDTEDTYKPSEMADAIESISGGGITPTGTIEITQNGVVDVTDYASADVDVPTGSTPVINSLSVTENGTYTAPSGVDGYSPITVNVSGGNTVLDNVISGSSAPIVSNVTTLKNWGLSYMTLTNINLPNLVTAGESAFQNTTCNPSRSLYFPELVTVKNSTFRSFKGVTMLVLPKVGAINGNTLFGDMSDIEALDFGVSVSQGFNTWSCSGCSKLSKIIIRKSNAIVTLANINALNATCFSSGGTGGVLYVPSSMISAYQSASNWSTILGYTNNQIKSIESTHTDIDAPIDLTLYYADGTPISSNS